MKVRYTPEAAERFLQVLTDLAAINPVAADRFARTVEGKFPRLATFPRSGFRVREFPDLQLREFIVEPYRFFYYVDEARQMVWIVDVWHGAQIPTYPSLPSIGAAR
jgi:plasmid stabilization system protein ParE